MNLKRFMLLAYLLFASTILFSGCGSEKQVENLSKEIDTLKQSNKELNEKVNSLKDENKKITDENNNLKEEYEKLKSKVKYQGDISKKVDKEKIAYLTFDDGPSSNTGKILDILKQNNIKATFFVNGHPEQVEMYKRVAREGHTIGNHTYSHDYKTVYSTIDGFMADEKKLDDFLISTIGHVPKILRFPGGSNNHASYTYGGKAFMNKLTQEVKKEGIVYFDWNVTSSDSDRVTQDKQCIINSALRQAKRTTKAIILMHDSKSKTTTVEALPAIIHGLKEQGFKFAPITPDVLPVQFK